MPNTLTLKTYGGRGEATFTKPETLEQAIAWCEAHTHVWFVANDGTARQVKINGRVRRWKRDAQRVEVSVRYRYGLYEYNTFDAEELMARLLIG